MFYLATCQILKGAKSEREIRICRFEELEAYSSLPFSSMIMKWKYDMPHIFLKLYVSAIQSAFKKSILKIILLIKFSIWSYEPKNSGPFFSYNLFKIHSNYPMFWQRGSIEDSQSFPTRYGMLMGNFFPKNKLSDKLCGRSCAGEKLDCYLNREWEKGNFLFEKVFGHRSPISIDLHFLHSPAQQAHVWKPRQ